MKHKYVLLASSAVLALSSAAQASAQQIGLSSSQQVASATGGAGGSAGVIATAAVAAAVPAPPSVAEVVVTAQRRSESLEKVPVAVTAFTSKQRDLVGIDTIQDITNFTPGFEYSTSLDRAYIRGVGRQTNNLSGRSRRRNL